MKTLFRIEKRVWLFLMWLCAGSFFFCGCAGVRPLSETESSSIRNHDKTLVLLRAVWNEKGTNRPVPISELPLKIWQLGNRNCEMLIPPQQHHVRWSAPSEAALKEGWVYAVLPAGNYYVETPQRFVGSENEFHLSVPGDGTVCYGGSLLYWRTEKSFPERPSYKYLSKSNEIELATAVTSNAWHGFSSVSPAAMTSYRTPPVEYLPGFEKMIAVESASTSKAIVNGDNMSAGVLAAAPFLLPGVFLLNAASKGGGEGAAYCAVAGLGLIVAGAPIAIATSGTVAGIHHFQWKPYELLLNEQVQNSNLTKDILDSMNGRLEKLSAATNKHNPSIALHIQPCRILLRGDSKQQFNLEIAVRVRLLNTETRSVLWDNTYVHSRIDEPDQVLLGRFEQQVFPAAVAHPLADYKGSAGRELLAQQFRTAADQLGAAIAESFRKHL